MTERTGVRGGNKKRSTAALLRWPAGAGQRGGTSVRPRVEALREVGCGGTGRRREEQAEVLGTYWSGSSEGDRGGAEHGAAAYGPDREAVFFLFSRSYRFG